ncbi:MAG: TonB-dependent receptor [Candidatus Symbiothrix sp.]|jgi:iron complex outermembrane receptor protein|nr:TonB-dependent receptor [Candidatus Symbiothrix sp.]
MKQKQLKSRQAYRFRMFARKAYAAFNSMHKIVNIGVIAGVALTLANTAQTTAQTTTISARDSIGKITELEELVVSSAKADLRLNQTARIVSVITHAEIERQPVTSVQDLLKNVVGLDVRQRGSNGVLAGVSVRGGTFEQTAILLNGANLTNPQTGHYNLDLPVNLSDIERIEIIQGPTSLLYGAGAFSGGVNIITKKNSENGGSVQLEGGMHQLFGGEARGSLKTGNSSHSLSAGYHSSDGYIENSDYKIFNALWHSSLDVEYAKLDLQLGWNDKEYGANTFYSAAYPNQFDNTRSIFSAIKGEAGNKLKLIPQLYWNRHYDHYQLIRDSLLVGNTMRYSNFGENFHRTDVFGFNLNMQYKWLAGITNFGGEIRNEGIKSSNLGRDSIAVDKFKRTDNRTNISYFAEHTFLYRGFTASAGLLVNYNTDFRNNRLLYPHINVGYWWNNSFKTYASWSTATRMPTFTDLYYKGVTHEGNSDVQPELSESFELGLKHQHPFITASLSGYYMKGDNLIDWVKRNPGDKWQSRNLTHLDKKGVEASISLRFQEIWPQLSPTRLDLAYLFMNQDKTSGNWISNYVMDYLRHKFTAGLSHPIYKGISADWQFRWQDRAGTYTKYENLTAVGETEYPPFALLDLKINWKIDRFNVYFTANNLLNTAYYDLGNIPQPGFWILGGVSVAIE